MDYMSTPLKIPRRNEAQKRKHSIANKKWRDAKKAADPDYLRVVNKRNNATASIREERRRMIKMDFRKQFSLPSQPLSGKDKLAHGKDVIDIVTARMMDFGKEMSSFGLEALEKTFAHAEGASAETKEVEEEVLVEKEPNAVTDDAFMRSYRRGVTHSQVVEALTYGEDQKNDAELYPDTHKRVTEQVTLVVGNDEPENVISTWPNTHPRAWKQARCPPAPYLRVQEGETPEQAEERMKKEINALLFWTRGRECSKFLHKLEDNEAEIKDLKEENDSLHRRLEEERSERFAMECHIEDMADTDTDVEELKFKMDCAEHANGYLQSQLDMATGMLSANEEPAKKRKRISYY